MSEENQDEYTVDELLAMDDDQFREAATEDLYYTGSWESIFQDRRVIARTHLALMDKLGFANEVLVRKAADPMGDPRTYERAATFCRHLTVVVNILDKQMTWLQGVKAREVSAWKELLNKVLDEIEDDEEFDDVLDEFEIPFRTNMTLRSWLQARRAKDPKRIPTWKAGELLDFPGAQELPDAAKAAA